jgi:hypothetical protein
MIIHDFLPPFIPRQRSNATRQGEDPHFRKNQCRNRRVLSPVSTLSKSGSELLIFLEGHQGKNYILVTETA